MYMHVNVEYCMWSSALYLQSFEASLVKAPNSTHSLKNALISIPITHHVYKGAHHYIRNAICVCADELHSSLTEGNSIQSSQRNSMALYHHHTQTQSVGTASNPALSGWPTTNLPICTHPELHRREICRQGPFASTRRDRWKLAC